MYDVITVGGISIDLYYKGKALTYDNNRFQLAIGGKYFTDYFTEGVGGAGANVAIGVAKAGLKVGVRGIIGNNPFKQIILQKLHDQNVSTDLCFFEDNYINISSILLTDVGERSIIIYRTPHQHLTQTPETLIKYHNAKIVYLGNMPDVGLDERINFISYLNQHNVPVAINAGLQGRNMNPELLPRLYENTSILILNTHEFADLVHVPIQGIDFTLDIVSLYASYLTDKLILVTDGEKGSYGYLNGKCFFQKAYPVDTIIDTTGSGDGYTAGFIAAYVKTHDVQVSMDKGALYATEILKKIGAN